jgi:hypothetical protein
MVLKNRLKRSFTQHKNRVRTIPINQKILIGQFILKPKSVLVSIILHEGIIIVPLQVVGHAVE